MQPTPGPWRANYRRIEHGPLAAGDGFLVAMVSLDCVEHEANARLIAHAPAMREALEQIAKGEGAFDRDPLRHAENVIKEHKTIARALLTAIDG